MAIKPQKGTIDKMLELYDSWDVETQERVMDQLVLVQRLAKRRAGRKPETSESEGTKE